MPTDHQPELNRRNFVKTAAAVTAAATAVTSQGPLVTKAKAAVEGKVHTASSALAAAATTC
jgi:hypothetical protein